MQSGEVVIAAIVHDLLRFFVGLAKRLQLNSIERVDVFAKSQTSQRGLLFG